MVLRSLIIGCYLMTAYWVSYHFPVMRMVFYPTLGAFSFIFMHRVGQMKDIGRIIIGATAAVTVGCLFYSIHNGAVSFFITTMITISMVRFFKWNAAPIVAVSLIPYFAHPTDVWALPIAVLISLVGLLLLLWILERMEQWSLLVKRFPVLGMSRPKEDSV
jgi:hypothetical protein